jgi:DNA-directed RNA polymerase specialized sigma24 family protein
VGEAVKIWRLTQEGLDSFLSCLDADRERAGEKYESIRSKLISFFEWRGAQFAEDQADETINRVIRKIAEGEHIRDPFTYVYGVARMVALEVARQRERNFSSLDSLRAVEPEETQETDRLECLRRCLQKLTENDRWMITEYYRDEKGEKIVRRKTMADRLGIPLNALRIRALRVREKLGSCIEGCLKKAAF